MSLKTDKKFRKFSVRMEEHHYDAIQKVATGRARSLNFIVVEYLIQMMKIKGVSDE